MAGKKPHWLQYTPDILPNGIRKFKMDSLSSQTVIIVDGSSKASGLNILLSKELCNTG